MIGAAELKARVEERLGSELDPVFFARAERYARRKLDLCNERAGRRYGEEGYGDEYLVLLTADTVREMAFSAWCEIRNEEIRKKGASDTARYRALGNSIAIPPWKWVLKRLCSVYERDATMGSLFDGIGGFPFIWERLNGRGSCLWASEIDKFAIAVTKERFHE